jgi:hypothetical protein
MVNVAYSRDCGTSLEWAKIEKMVGKLEVEKGLLLVFPFLDIPSIF